MKRLKRGRGKEELNGTGTKLFVNQFNGTLHFTSLNRLKLIEITPVGSHTNGVDCSQAFKWGTALHEEAKAQPMLGQGLGKLVILHERSQTVPKLQVIVFAVTNLGHHDIRDAGFLGNLVHRFATLDLRL